MYCTWLAVVYLLGGRAVGSGADDQRWGLSVTNGIAKLSVAEFESFVARHNYFVVEAVTDDCLG